MKKLIIAGIAIAGIFAADTAQAEGDRNVTVVHKGTNTDSANKTVYTLNANEVLHLTSLTRASVDNQIRILADIDGASNLIVLNWAQYNGQRSEEWYYSNLSEYPLKKSPFSIAGPATVKIQNSNTTSTALMTFKISPNLAE